MAKFRLDVKAEVAELYQMEQEKKDLEERIAEKRADLLQAMRVGQEVPYDAQNVFVKLDKETWKITPEAVYEEVGPKKFLKFVNSVSIPTVREELGEMWMRRHGKREITDYVTWIHKKV